MDTPKWQSAALSKRLIQELSQIRQHLASLQEQVSAVRDAAETANDQTRGPQEPLPIELHADLQIPESQQGEQRKQNTRQNQIQGAMALGTWLAFIAAAIYAGIAASQLGEMRIATTATQTAANAASDSAATQTKAFHMDQRAWVMPSHPGNVSFVVNSEIVVPISLENTGKTPALNVDGDLVVALLQKTEIPEFVYTQNSGHPLYKIKGGLMFPKEPTLESYPVTEHGKGTIKRKARTIILTPELNTELTAGDQSWIAIHGQINYWDVFGIQHWTHFCWVASFPGTLRNALQPGKAVCSKRNSIDTNQ